MPKFRKIMPVVTPSVGHTKEFCVFTTCSQVKSELWRVVGVINLWPQLRHSHCTVVTKAKKQSRHDMADRQTNLKTLLFATAFWQNVVTIMMLMGKNRGCCGKYNCASHLLRDNSDPSNNYSSTKVRILSSSSNVIFHSFQKTKALSNGGVKRAWKSW